MSGKVLKPNYSDLPACKTASLCLNVIPDETDNRTVALEMTFRPLEIMTTMHDGRPSSTIEG